MPTTDGPAPTFARLGVPPALVRALAERGITRAFPIQVASLPDSIAGRDVLGQGRTGSGKTVAFALPVIERVSERPERRRPKRPRALVLVPTRELAVQVADTIDHLASAVHLKTMTVFGGVRYQGQLRKLERGVDVVIATPGRLEDLMSQGALRLDDVAVVVLDEADLMVDMGFLPSVVRVLEQVPAGQRMLFSATLDGDVQGIVDRFLDDPLVHAVDEGHANPDIDHHLFLVTMSTKRQVLRELVTGAGRTLLFARTKTFAERLAAELAELGVSSAELHGNLKQAARQRNLAAFADGTVQVLVATDIAARGLHIDGVGLVVHVDPPGDPKAFLHRSGRTARAGAEGTVVTLATKQQHKAVRRMMTSAAITPVVTAVEPGDPIVAEVRAPRVAAPVRAGASIFEPDPQDAPDEAQRQRAAAGGSRGALAAAGGAWGARAARGAGQRPREGRARDDRRPAERRPAGRSWDERPRDERPRADGRRDERPRDERPRDDRAREVWARNERPGADRPRRSGGPHPSREPRQPLTGWGHRDQNPDRARAEYTRPDRGRDGRSSRNDRWTDAPDRPAARRRADAWAALDTAEADVDPRDVRRAPDRGRTAPGRDRPSGARTAPDRSRPAGPRADASRRDGARPNSGRRSDTPARRPSPAPASGPKAGKKAKVRWTAEDRAKRDRTQAWREGAGPKKAPKKKPGRA